MKKSPNVEVIILKQCEYLPPGASAKVPVRPGQTVTVTPKQREDMIKGNVAKDAAKEEEPKKPVKKK